MKISSNVSVAEIKILPQFKNNKILKFKTWISHSILTKQVFKGTVDCWT